MRDIKMDLKKLCLATGVAGLEFEASEVAAEMLREYTDEVKIDYFGNVYGIVQCGEENAKTILLDAHIDEIGMVVTSVDEKGFVKFSSCGGIDLRLMAAQVVTIHGKKDITGVIGSKPPHLETKEEADKVADIDDMYIDIGYSKEKALEVISLGDKITIPSQFVEMLNDRVSCKAIDDRSGVCAILYGLELLKEKGKKLDVNVAVQFSTREEIGGQGAKISSFSQTPDMALAIDVSFAHTPDADEHKCGKMSGGTIISCHAVLDRHIYDKLIKLAEENKIDYQIEASGGRSTGTNADSIISTKSGVRAGILGIPLKFMHSPIEQIAIGDIEKTAMLIAEFCAAGGVA